MGDGVGGGGIGRGGVEGRNWGGIEGDNLFGAGCSLLRDGIAMALRYFFF